MQGKKFAVSDYTTAEEIKAVRKHLKLTQKEFAELICCGKLGSQQGKDNRTVSFIAKDVGTIS